MKQRPTQVTSPNPEKFLEKFKSISEYDAGLYELAHRAERTLDFDFSEGLASSLLPGLGRLACVAYRSPTMRRSVDADAIKSVHPGKRLLPTGFLGAIEFREYEDRTSSIGQPSQVLSIFVHLQETNQRQLQNDSFAVALSLEVSTAGKKGLALAHSRPGSDRLERRHLASALERQAVRSRTMLRLNELVIGYHNKDG